MIVAAPTHALSLLNNLPLPGSGERINIGFNPPAQNQAAVGFTLPTGNNYTLNSIELRLTGYNTTQGDIAELQIFEDPTRTSTDPNGAVFLGSVPTLPPVSSSNATNTFNFALFSNFTLRANSRY
ncbi:MAG: hypothetical protein HC919_09680 [Oscillatoriales cyanobacterium SM2_2_1]|nr:hypothetical protein [Oscillatoriales cyanobacterium SM2_2_1]